MNENGERYRRKLDKLRRGAHGHATPSEVWALVSRPRFARRYVTALGLKEFRAKDAIFRYQSLPGLRYPIARLILRTILIVYDFAFVGFLGGLLLVWAGLQVRIDTPLGGSVRVLGVVVAASLVVTILLLTLEPTVVYGRLGSYSAAFQNPLKYVNNPASGSFVSELLTLIFLAFAVLYVDTTILAFLVNGGFDSFGSTDLFGLSALFSCLYSVFMTFVLSSPLSPTTSIGQAFQIVFTAQGVLIVTVALAGLVTVAKFARTQQ